MASELAILGGPSAVVQQPDLRWPRLSEEEIQAAVDLLRKGEVSYYGREGLLKEFEDNFCRYHNMPYALACNSGTATLHSAFFGLEIGPGDEVLAPSYTFLATVTPILQCNAVPVLCDAEPDTGNIDPADIRRKLTARTRAVVVTHMWGHPCEMDVIMEIAKQYRLHVIEDCSHAHGATYKGRLVGTIGDVGCFSLQAKKIITGGTGGILITRSQRVYERATLLGHFRVRSQQCVTSPDYHRFHDTGFGHNYRMHPVAAAIVNVQLKDLPRRIEGRRQNMTHLSRLLSDIPGIVPPVTRSHVTRGAWYGYKPFYNPKDMYDIPKAVYIRTLQAEGVSIKEPGSKPLHLSPLFQEGCHKLFNYGCPTRCPYGDQTLRLYRQGQLPVAESFHERTLSLPVFTERSFPLIEAYAAAFQKVAHHAAKLKAALDEGRLTPVLDAEEHGDAG